MELCNVARIDEFVNRTDLVPTSTRLHREFSYSAYFMFAQDSTKFVYSDWEVLLSGIKSSLPGMQQQEKDWRCFSPLCERSVLLLIIYSSVWNYKSIMPYVTLVHVRNWKKTTLLTSTFCYLSKSIKDFTLCLNSFTIVLLWMIHWHM